MRKLWVLAFAILGLAACQHSAHKTNETPKVQQEKAEEAKIYVSTDGNSRFSVNFIDSENIQVTNLSDGKKYNLKITPAASGAKYSDSEGHVFWTKGNDFMWMKDDELITSGKITSQDQGQKERNTAFNKTLELQGIGFNITATRNNGMSEVTISPFGLEIDNRPVTHQMEGSITDAEIEDLNADGSPEVLIYSRSDGSGSYGNVLAYSVNNRKSMSDVYFAPVTGNPALSKGYMGHDEFRVVENYLVQRFPIYNEGDSNAKPTGGIRQITYKLVNGEASRRFEVKDIITLDR